MAGDSEEIDFSQEITSDSEGNIIMEPINNNDDDEGGDDNDNNDEDIDGQKPDNDDEDNQDDNNTDDNDNNDSDDNNNNNDDEDNNTDDEDNKKNEEDSSTFETFEAVINGQIIEVESAEEAQAIINNLSQPKLEQPDVWSQAQEKLGVTTKDLALVSAVKGGDSKALLFLAKQAGLDISQLIYDEAPDSFDADFKPTVKTEGELVMGDIESSGEMGAFTEALNMTDSNFIQNLGDVKNLNAFRKQVKSGKAAELMPKAKKLALVKGIPLFEAYATLGHEAKTDKTDKTVTKTVTKKTPPLKKAPKSADEASKGEESAEDIWSLSDEEFNKRFGGSKI